MDIWLLLTTAIGATSIGYNNFSLLKTKAKKKSYMYYIFAALCFISPALGFSYIFHNLTPSFINTIFLGFIVGTTMAIPSCIMQFYYRNQ